MPLRSVTPLPVAPSRDNPANFSAVFDAFLSALGIFRTETNNANTDLTQLTQQVTTEADYVLAFRNRYFGEAAADPMNRPAIPPQTVGGAIEIGDLYFNNVAKEIRVFTGTNGWRSIGSYVTGNIDVTNYLRANRFIPFQLSFKNAPTANLEINRFSHFVVQTNTSTQLNFAYVPITPNALEATEFTVDLLTQTGFVLSFPTNTRWSGNVTPTFTANRRHLLRFFTSDSGATWLGSVEVLNASATGAPVLT